MPLRRRSVTLVVPLAIAAAPSVGAQSLLDRSPNVSGNWVGSSGTVHFNFLHRFDVSDAPERKVSNLPTFLLGVGLPLRTFIGAHYATNSQLVGRYPNEWEFFARYAPLAQDENAPLDLGAQAGYNLAAEGVDGELSVARRQGPVRVIALARVLSNPYGSGDTRFAVGGGATVRFGRWVALAADVAALTDRDPDPANDDPGADVAWSAGIHVGIPNTPHTLSLQAANTNTATLQGASRGGDEVRYGFEFTIPITLRRYFGSRRPPDVAGAAADTGVGPRPPRRVTPDPVARVPEDSARPGGAVRNAGMRNNAFTPSRIEIVAGTTVAWRNNDQMAHTVTADDRSFDSGTIEPGATWRRTFDRPGTYPFFCTPHPFMKGVVVVRDR